MSIVFGCWAKSVNNGISCCFLEKEHCLSVRYSGISISERHLNLSLLPCEFM